MKSQSNLVILDSTFFKLCHIVNINDFNRIKILRCDFDISCYRKELFDMANINFPTSLENSMNKRQAEFLAGRYAATLALEELGFNQTDIPIGKHRSPVWPENIVASITHTNTSALCAAAFSRDYTYLGIDSENWLVSDTIKEIKNSIIQTGEEDLLLKNSMGFERAFTLTFSAKES